MDENQIAKVILDAAYLVHRQYGPGLLESAYEALLAHEITKRGLLVKRQLAVPISHDGVFDGVLIELGYRIDLLIADLVVVAFEAVVNTTADESAKAQKWPSGCFCDRRAQSYPRSQGRA